MSPQPDQDTDRSVLSWESVLDATDTETKPETQTGIAPAAAQAHAPAPPPAAPIPSPALGDINLTIAPLSLDPLSLDPLPPIGDNSGTRAPAALNNANVLGDLHLELPPLDLDDTAVPAPPSPAPDPVAAVAAVAAVARVDAVVDDVIELTIAPLDIPDLTPSGQVPSVAPEVPMPTASLAESDVADETSRRPAAVAGLPNDVVSHDH